MFHEKWLSMRWWYDGDVYITAVLNNFYINYKQNSSLKLQLPPVKSIIILNTIGRQIHFYNNYIFLACKCEYN